MNRRSFFNLINRLVVGSVVLPLEQLSYCPVKQEVIKPKINNDILTDYKGEQFFEAGIIYAPYIPLFQTYNLVQK